MTLYMSFTGDAHINDLFLDGDIYPSNFSFNDVLVNADLLKLYKRSEFVQILIDWMVFESFRKGINFITDEGPVLGTKFDQPYTFSGFEYVNPDTLQTISQTGFDEYLQWINFWNSWYTAAGWSRLYPDGSLIVFLDDIAVDTSKTTDIPWPANTNPQGYLGIKVFQPVTAENGIGFEPAESSDGKITLWKVSIWQDHLGNKLSFLIEADRCLHLTWKKKQNGWKGSSRIEGIAKLCVAETQTFNKLLKRAHDISGGLLHIEVESEKEQETILNAIGNNLSAVDIVFTFPGREVDYKTPDIKASTEFMSIFEIYTRKFVRHMRINQEILDGNKQGAGLSGNTDNDVLVGYSEMYQIQEFYRNALEQCFFKLGKKDTRFIYNEILPDNLAIMQQFNDTLNQNNSESGSNQKETNTEEGADTNE